MQWRSEVWMAVGLALAVAASAHAGGGGPQLVTERGELRMYVATDKPLYRPGETVWFRAWEVRARGLAPVAEAHAVHFELVDPKGAVVARRKVRASDGRAANDFPLDAGLVGGAYVVRARSDSGATAERPIVVSSYERPRIKKTVELLAASYGPGERVSAAVQLVRNTGEPVAGARITGMVWLDGHRLTTVRARSDAGGATQLRFELPAAIERGDCLLTVMVEDGGAPESIQRRVPIAIDRIELQLYPEGGELVAGLRSRVYVRALDLLGEPVAVRGVVVDDRGVEVAEVADAHLGRGRFELVPEAGRRYAVRVRGHDYPLPVARAEGCVLRAIDDFAGARDAIELDVACTEDRELIATAVLREELLAHAKARPGRVRLAVPRGAQGAVRVTVFGADLQPLAERLVYRGLGQGMTVTIRADRDGYGPRDRVTLAIETRGPDGAPVASEVAVAVVDDTVLNFADVDHGHLLAHMYLLPEMPGQVVREPSFYFSDDPKAGEAMDLLLGTQGWRRFQWAWRK